MTTTRTSSSGCTARRRPSGPLPCVYSIHGGGYVLGTYAMDDARFDACAPTFPCVGVSVEYRLAPETPYPGPLDDCYAGLRWTFEHADELGIDPDRIGITGVSAGGGLAAALALLAAGPRRGAGRVPAARVPDDRRPPDHVVEPAGRAADLEPRVEQVRLAQLPRDLYGTDDVPPYAAPPRRRPDRAAPAFVIVGGADGFRDEDIDYAMRLNQAGVPTELHVLPGLRTACRCSPTPSWRAGGTGSSASGSGSSSAPLNRRSAPPSPPSGHGSAPSPPARSILLRRPALRARLRAISVDPKSRPAHSVKAAKSSRAMRSGSTSELMATIRPSTTVKPMIASGRPSMVTTTPAAPLTSAGRRSAAGSAYVSACPAAAAVPLETDERSGRRRPPSDRATTSGSSSATSASKSPARGGEERVDHRPLTGDVGVGWRGRRRAPAVERGWRKLSSSACWSGFRKFA